MVFKLAKKQKRDIDLKISSQNYYRKCYFWPIFQNFTKWYFLRQERGFLRPKIGWERGITYFTSFLSKMVKRVKGVRYIWIFSKIWILRFLDDFWPKSRFTLFGTLFTLFLAGPKKYYISAISPINIGQIGQIAKKLWEVKILTYKKRQILYINRSRKTFVRDMLQLFSRNSICCTICCGIFVPKSGSRESHFLKNLVNFNCKPNSVKYIYITHECFTTTIYVQNLSFFVTQNFNFP